MRKRVLSKTRISLAVVAVFAALSCSLDYEQALIADDLSEEVPDTVLYSFTHVSVENGRPTLRMSAEIAETFSKRNETVLTDASFLEYDEKGEVASEGNASRAIYSTDSEDAELTGGIYVYSKSQEAEITAQSLSWADATRTLSGSEGEYVSIRKDSGSRLDGSGFSADMRTREFRFSGVVSGSWADEEDE